MEKKQMPGMTARAGLNKFVEVCSKKKARTVLDIGAGEIQRHSKVFRSKGFDVTTVDFAKNADHVGDYLEIDLPQQYDAIWCAHVLEHQHNVKIFLHKLMGDVKEGGVIAITVPPLKHNIVGGHVSLWNPGILLYNLIIAGLDCSDAKVKTYGYNISVIMEKKTITKLPKLSFGNGDLERLRKYFPRKLNAKQGFNGDIKQLNW